ncbi:MAG TPA: hypothetical protein VE954_28485 [Oligoflexus sp.]|uniref:hypothetical protein n=1 Tax=Oligoflexus sp. TaxID=1971216 RepID=UPI002D30C119|nr:hypothetical protein [Oligoflexus sp.]HYX37058.1 hypothetical protein [Oligoflexus sp.]
MKYMNHLRKLALLSSLALSFSLTVQADGTLPLPIDQSKEKLPMKFEADSSDLTLRIESMMAAPAGKLPTPIQPCGSSETLYSASGTVKQGIEELYVVGICKPGTNSLSRTVVTVDAKTLTKATQFVLLQGTLGVETDQDPITGAVVSSTRSLTGVMNVKPFSGLAPVGPEALTPFALYRTQ